MKHVLWEQLMVVLLAAFLATGIIACGRQKYQVHFNELVFTSPRTMYAAGEQVEVCYGIIATDTDYDFFSEDVELNVTWDDRKGYVLRFTMPDHDVTIDYDSHNSMLNENYVEEESK